MLHAAVQREHQTMSLQPRGQPLSKEQELLQLDEVRQRGLRERRSGLRCGDLRRRMLQRHDLRHGDRSFQLRKRRGGLRKLQQSYPALQDRNLLGRYLGQPVHLRFGWRRQ